MLCNINVQTLLNFDKLSVVVASGGALTLKPKNAIGLQNASFTLECASDSSYITWFYDNSLITSRGCTSSNRWFSAASGSNATQCSLVVRGNDTTRHSGPFTCNAGYGSSAEAVVIIIGQ